VSDAIDSGSYVANNPPMQTLGLSSSMPKSESRFKSIFWPSIRNSSDVDYLGAQGYWICSAVAVLSLIVSIFTDHPIAGAFTFLFFYVGGVGVREHSRYAAAVVLILYVGDVLVSGPGALKVFLSAILLSNLRATWIASRWTSEPDGAAIRGYVDRQVR
jgi:hypothetical protein